MIESNFIKTLEKRLNWAVAMIFPCSRCTARWTVRGEILIDIMYTPPFEAEEIYDHFHEKTIVTYSKYYAFQKKYIPSIAEMERNHIRPDIGCVEIIKRTVHEMVSNVINERL